MDRVDDPDERIREGGRRFVSVELGKGDMDESKSRSRTDLANGSTENGGMEDVEYRKTL